jgi:hypothetical protein
VPTLDAPAVDAETPEALEVATGLVTFGEDWLPVVDEVVVDLGVATATVLLVVAGMVRARAAVVAPTPTTKAASDQFDSRLRRWSPLSRGDPSRLGSVATTEPGRRVLLRSGLRECSSISLLLFWLSFRYLSVGVCALRDELLVRGRCERFTFFGLTPGLSSLSHLRPSSLATCVCSSSRTTFEWRAC